MANKILIIKPSGIGDIVHSLPVAFGLKEIFKDSIIHWVVFSKFSSILENFQYVDKIVLWNRNGGIKEYINLIKELKNQKYDLVIDLQVLLRTAFLGYLIYGRKVISTSFVREFSNFFVRPVAKFNSQLHAVERNYQVVEYLAKQENKKIKTPKEYLPWIKINEEENLYAKKLLNFNERNKYVVFSISSRGRHKIWHYKNFVSLILKLKENLDRIIPVFVGSNSDEFIVRNVVAYLDDLPIEYRNLTGKTTLRELCAVINNSDLTISNDNGIAHISAALNKPTLVLFGPSNPNWFYPYNDKSGYIYKSLKCSPCGIKTSCKNNICMQQIEVEEVFDYILEKFAEYIK